MSILHVKSVTVADGTATSVVRPSDWNSAHQMLYNLSGNTQGSAQVGGADVVLVGGNNITLSADTAASKVVFVGPAVPAQTVQTQNMVSVQGSTGAISFANGNGITFGGNVSTLTASHNGITQQSTQPVAVSAANGSAAFSTLSLANSNGVSFSTGTQGVYATVRTDYQSAGAYLTTARASNDAIGLNTALTGNGVSVTANSSGLSINVPAFLTTAMQSGAGTQFVQANAGFAGTNISGTIASSGISLSVAPGGGAGDGYNILAAGTQTANTTGTVGFVNSNGITFGMTNSSLITASHNGITQQSTQTQPAGNIAGAGYTSTTQAGSTAGATQNSNGMSMAWPPFITTYAAQTVQPAVAQLNGSSGTMSLNVGSSLSASTNGSTITFGLASNITTALQSAGAYLTTAAQSTQTLVLSLGGNSGTTNSSQIGNGGFVFAGGNNVTLSQSNNSVSIHGAAPGGTTIYTLQRYMLPDVDGISAISAIGNGSMSINWAHIPVNVTATRLDVPLLFSWSSSATAATYGFVMTAYAALYTKNGSTLSSVSSGSATYGFTAASNTAGSTQLLGAAVRPVSVPININMTPGEYYFGFGISTNTSSNGTATTALNLSISAMGMPSFTSAIGWVGDFTATTNTSTGWLGGAPGVYSAATSGPPAAVSISAINQTGSYYGRGNIAALLRNV